MVGAEGFLIVEDTPASEMDGRNWAACTIVGLLVLFVGLVYQTGGPVWDDHVLIVDDLVRRDVRGIIDLWTAPLGDSGPGKGYYRPLSMSVIALLARGGFWFIHVMTACLHVASVCMLMRLLKDQRGQVLAGLCFGLHPLVSEVLGWASALPDALAVCSALAAILVLRSSMGWALVLSLAAVASKETGLLVLVVLAIGTRQDRRAWACIGVCMLFVLLPRLLLGVESSFDLTGRLELIPAALTWPLSWLLWPAPLSVVHDLWIAPDWVVWFSSLLILVLLFTGRRSRLALAGVALCVGAPLLALVPSLSAYMVAERYMYPAVLGLSLWVGCVVPIGRVSIALACMLGVLSVGLHAQRAGEWVRDRTLFDAALVDAPGSSYSWHFVGIICKQEGNWACVARSNYRALTLGHPPNEVGSLATLMEALTELGEPERALQFAVQGPEHARQSDYFVWAWARAAIESGNVEFARSILGNMERPPGWVAPGPLLELRGRLGMGIGAVVAP